MQERRGAVVVWLGGGANDDLVGCGDVFEFGTSYEGVKGWGVEEVVEYNERDVGDLQ